VAGARGTDRTAGPVGLCVVRVWRYGDDLLVRLHVRDDVDVPATERVILTSDVEEAAAAVATFLAAARARPGESRDG
jgi:hypothetical protein